MDYIPAAIIGLGPVGQLTAKIAATRPNIRLVAAADIAPDYQNRELGEILGLPPLGVTVRPTIEEALHAAAAPGVAIICTGSWLKKITPQIIACLDAGWHVVSTCEQLSYPFASCPEESRLIDEKAKQKGVAVLGTGVNPGFAMDILPVFISGVCTRVHSILIERFQDASLRRLPFQQKIGAGLDLADFEKKVAEMTIRHVGFSESVQLIAAAMHVPLERIEERVYPVMAAKALRSQFIEIPPGRVCGVDQICQGYYNDRAIITLHLQAYFGHPDPKDRTFIDGEPPLDVTVKGGIPGDTATCAMAVNAVSRIVNAQAGLRTMLDAGVVSSWLAR
jgi:4-hydroxy-tetrahydrodipicolinate reductase